MSLPQIIESRLIPIEDTAAVMPLHGTVSIAPAKSWEDGLAAGNGTMGALIYGDPAHETIIANHCKLWLPLGSHEVVPDTGDVLPKWRRIIKEHGYGSGQKFFFEKAREHGWKGDLVWTDPFHPGFFLTIDQEVNGSASNYSRVSNFETGEATVQWTDHDGHFERRMIVSKADNVIVVTTKGPPGKLSMHVKMQPLENEKILQTIVHSAGLITCHNSYVHGKGGYDGAALISTEGGTIRSDGESVDIVNATTATIIMRIQPWKTPLPVTEAWPYDSKNPEFSTNSQTAGLYRAAKAYHTRWADDLLADLKLLPNSFDDLLARHTKIWSDLYGRVTIDMKSTPAERGMSSESLLDLAEREQRMPNALLERMYDAGRYVFMCSAGSHTPPNLFGIWTGTWQPAWSGDYTTDTNLQLDIECAYSCNMAECMEGYFQLWDSYVPDFQRNAMSLFGCRGILVGSRASNNGLSLHWDESWPGNLWTPGAPWIAHWYYDHYLYTGDLEFLEHRAIPFMEQCALFYEDFLATTESSSGKYTFIPSFSAENGWGDNASQDIEICQELLTNLIAACHTLGIKPDDVSRWERLLSKLPPLLINEKGQLKEWSNTSQGEKNDHRHLMHLYGAFECRQFTEDADPLLFNAAKVALLNRVSESREDATHGWMHTSLAATGLGMGNLAYSQLSLMAKHRSIFSNMVDGHFGGPRILCDDGNGATPEIVNRMIIQSEPGHLYLLPAVPDALSRGILTGTRARSRILLDCIEWDITSGKVSVSITSEVDQRIDVTLPATMIIDQLLVDGRIQQNALHDGTKCQFSLELRTATNIVLDIKFHS